MYSESKEREEKKVELLNRLSILFLGLFLVGMCSAHGQQLVSTQEIRGKLCTRDMCQVHWNSTALLYCNSTPAIMRPNEDMVFGTYTLGRQLCYCPCNFAKFYN